MKVLTITNAKKMKSLLYILLFIVFVNGSLVAQSYQTENGEAIFHSKVPLHTFSGTSKKLQGLINLDEKTVDFYLDLATLDTGNGKRDKDMRSTLDVDKHPFGEFFGKLVSDFDAGSTEVQEVKVKGNFKIHGVEKEVEVEGTLQQTSEGLKLYATWILRLEDYDIVPPKLLFIKVDQEQEIEINAILKPKG